MVSHRWMIAGLMFLLASSSPVMAGNEAQQINERIKALREKLQTYREEHGLAEKKSRIEHLDPAELSEQLEHRSDARMVVLFHDAQAEPQATPPRDETGKNVDQEQKPELSNSQLGLAFERLRSLAELRRKSEEKRGIKLAAGK